MARIFMVRHGEAEASWGQDRDPGLSRRGAEQAEAAAERLEPEGPIDILTSPLKRCRETCLPLSRKWSRLPKTEPTVAEIVSPSQDLSERSEWLKGIFTGTWSETEPSVQEWRNTIPETLLSIETDSVIFSHFVAINVAVGFATGKDEVVCFRPDNCSVTIFENNDGKLRLVELGAEAKTQIG